MIVYGNHCNAGRIHRTKQPLCDSCAPKPSRPSKPSGPLKPKAKARGGRRRVKRAVIRVEDGKRYGSVSEAAQDVNGSPGNVVTAIQRDWLHKGYHWRYADEEEK